MTAARRSQAKCGEQEAVFEARGPASDRVGIEHERRRADALLYWGAMCCPSSSEGCLPIPTTGSARSGR